MSDSKSTQERQKEILEAARQLFFTKGYEATTTTDIMKCVGIAKGTLYYHFASKEEILDALLEDIVRGMELRARTVMEDGSLSVVSRMVGVIRAISVKAGGDGAIVDVLHLPQNALFHEKSHSLTIMRISPIMLAVVKDGIEQGLFKTKYPESAVHMAMTYALTAFDDVSSMNEGLIRGFVYNLERMLGAQEGTLGEFLALFTE